MLASLPFLLTVFGTPYAIVALIPANLIWSRIYRGHGRGLSALYLTSPGAAAMQRRLRGAHRGAAAALAVTLLAAAVCVALVFSDGTDGRLSAVAGPIAALAGLLVLLAWPVPNAEHPVARVRSVPLSWREKRALRAVGGLAAFLVAVVIVDGLWSVPDVPSPHYRAFPKASVVEWWYSFDGVPKDIEYTLHGVTAPWPGWWYGVPLLIVTAALVLAGWAVLLRIHRLPATGPLSARDADDTVRMLLSTIVIALAAAGLLTSVIFVLTMMGDVLTSISLYPKPKIDNYGVLKPAGYTEPWYGIGLVLSWAWVALGLLALAALWVALFAARELRSGYRSARRVLAAQSASGEHGRADR